VNRFEVNNNGLNIIVKWKWIWRVTKQPRREPCFTAS